MLLFYRFKCIEFLRIYISEERPKAHSMNLDDDIMSQQDKRAILVKHLGEAFVGKLFSSKSSSRPSGPTNKSSAKQPSTCDQVEKKLPSTHNNKIPAEQPEPRQQEPEPNLIQAEQLQVNHKLKSKSQPVAQPQAENISSTTPPTRIASSSLASAIQKSRTQQRHIMIGASPRRPKSILHSSQ
jgi:hypothetical protein